MNQNKNSMGNVISTTDKIIIPLNKEVSLNN